MRSLITFLVVFYLVTAKEGLTQDLLLPVAKSSAPKGTWSLDLSHDDNLIVTGGDDSLLRFYDANKHVLINAYRLKDVIRHVKWHPQKNVVAITGRFNEVLLFDIQKQTITSIIGLKYGSRAVAWNYNGQLLAVADGAGMVRIWNESGQLLRSISKPDTKSYLSLDWHPFENKLVVSGDDIRIMDTSGATLQAIRHRKEYTGILTVRWHPSGRFISSGDYGHHNEGVESLIQFWSLEGKEIKKMISSKKEYRILSWSKDGKFLATSGDALRIYNNEGKLIKTGPFEKETIWGIDWNKAGNKIFVAGFDGSLKVFDNKARILKTIHP